MPFTCEYVISSFVEVVQEFWRRCFLNVINVFVLFGYFIPLEKARSFTWTNFNSPYPRIVRLNRLRISGENENLRKIADRRTDRPTNDGWQVIRKAHTVCFFRSCRWATNFRLRCLLRQTYAYQNIKYIIHSLKYSINFDYYNQTINKQCKYHYSDAAVVQWLKNVDPASGRFGVRIQAATELSRKNRQWQLHC